MITVWFMMGPGNRFHGTIISRLQTVSIYLESVNGGGCETVRNHAPPCHRITILY